MAVDVRFLGHACFECKSGGVTLLIDPYITDNPKAAVGPEELEPDAILLTHGHFDHLGDTVDIARRTGAKVVATKELADEISGDGIENVADPLTGGTVAFDWGSVKLVPAWHFGVTPKGTVHAPAGLLIEFGDRLIYHLGDTALFSDLRLVGRPGRRIDLAIVPIGGHYTMDRFDAVVAVELVAPDLVIPCHYDTFPPIETDAQAFKTDVQDAGYAEVAILAPGESYTLR